ncbi:hypothetical protein DPMN_186586 [Dreissena polymorpha]|uniref:Uncharacterized protein n=1 Tax=Dreissena polymorpha TaxID=45954 RepID=A0A9D4DMU7_DREPO|nr:hypothetical protein DPMN_186586 [Dreissena polymorpha]
MALNRSFKSPIDNATCIQHFNHGSYGSRPVIPTPIDTSITPVMALDRSFKIPIDNEKCKQHFNHGSNGSRPLIQNSHRQCKVYTTLQSRQSWL